jgi:hypothetical protein
LSQMAICLYFLVRVNLIDEWHVILYCILAALQILTICILPLEITPSSCFLQFRMMIDFLNKYKFVKYYLWKIGNKIIVIMWVEYIFKIWQQKLMNHCSRLYRIVHEWRIC